MSLFGKSKVNVLDLNEAYKALQDNAKDDDSPDTVIWLDTDGDGNIVSVRKESLFGQVESPTSTRNMNGVTLKLRKVLGVLLLLVFMCLSLGWAFSLIAGKLGG